MRQKATKFKFQGPELRTIYLQIVFSISDIWNSEGGRFIATRGFFILFYVIVLYFPWSSFSCFPCFHPGREPNAAFLRYGKSWTVSCGPNKAFERQDAF